MKKYVCANCVVTCSIEVEGLELAPKRCPFCTKTKATWIKAETFGLEAFNAAVEKLARGESLRKEGVRG